MRNLSGLSYFYRIKTVQSNLVLFVNNEKEFQSVMRIIKQYYTKDFHYVKTRQQLLYPKQLHK